MSDTIAYYLESIRNFLPASLIDKTGYTRAMAVAAQIPKYLSTFWGFEVRLGTDEALADILFSVKKDSEGQRLITETSFPSGHLQGDTGSAWKKLHDFAGLWSLTGHPLHELVHNVWLEFDASDSGTYPDASRVIAHPNLFFGPDNDRMDKTALAGIMHEALNILAPDGTMVDETLSFIESLPPDADLFQVGLMLPRPTDAIRVCVKAIPPDRISSWLAGIKWNGDPAALDRLIETITGITSDLAVDLDLAHGGIADRIGLECYMDWMADDTVQWSKFLDAIDHLNLCQPSKREGLLAYPGTNGIQKKKSHISDGIICLEIYRKINHLKLTFIQDRAIEAKAYLAVIHPALDFKKPNGWRV